MKTALGWILIVCGVLAIFSALSLQIKPMPAGGGDAERLGQAVGSILCVVVPIGLGAALINSATKSEVKRRRRLRDRDWDEVDDLPRRPLRRQHKVDDEELDRGRRAWAQDNDEEPDELPRRPRRGGRDRDQDD